jgi:hypothetical protein
MQVWNIRPALRFYMNRPLSCIEAHEIHAGLRPRHAYLISERHFWPHIDPPGRVVFEGYGFILTQWD